MGTMARARLELDDTSCMPEGMRSQCRNDLAGIISASGNCINDTGLRQYPSA